MAKKAAKKKTTKKAGTTKAKAAHPDESAPVYGVVADGRSLFWPASGYPFRLGVGGIVRKDDPFLNVKGVIDQTYKVRWLSEEERVDMGITKVSPCNRRDFFGHYGARGINWMGLELQGSKPAEPNVGPETVEDPLGGPMPDVVGGDDGFEIPEIEADSAPGEPDSADVERAKDRAEARAEDSSSEDSGDPLANALTE